MHRGLTVPVPTLRLWDSLSEGIGRVVASPPFLVGYVRWDARSNQESPPCQTVVSTALQLAVEHNEIAAASKPSPRKIVFAETKREADPILLMGKAEDTEEEPGKRTQWNRRGMGSGITGQIRRITSGRSCRQQGLMATCTDSSNEAKAEGGESRRGSAHESVRAMNEG